jgi:triacylglycerol lipase
MPVRSQVARLLQLTCLANLLAAATWCAWRWPQSPAQALLGALLVLLAGPIVLGVEFLLLVVLRREDPAPKASASELLAAWIAESVHLYAAFAWRQAWRWRTIPDPHPDARRKGVVLVHGFFCNRGFWNAWLHRLQRAGVPAVAVNLEPAFTSIDDYAPIIDAAVRNLSARTGKPPLVVCHSMGGLAFRAWWRASGGRCPVSHVVTIGSPHHGTWMGRFSRRTNARQMNTGSAWLRELQAHELQHPLPPTTCWYSNCDNIVVPPSTATHPGADNRFVPGQPHVALAFHPAVVEDCLRHVQVEAAVSR